MRVKRLKWLRPQPPCPAYVELQEVMECATAKLDLPWKRKKEDTARGRLDERFLSEHNHPAPVSLKFCLWNGWTQERSPCAHIIFDLNSGLKVAKMPGELG